MKGIKLYIKAGFGLLLLTICAILFVNSPDRSSQVFVIIMAGLVSFGYYYGIFLTMTYGRALARAREIIIEARSLSGNNVWEYIKRMGVFFHNEKLDAEFARYKHQVNQQQANQEDIVQDIETTIDYVLLERLTKKALVNEISNTLTGLGILGTFIGLLTGISKIGFTSIEAMMDNFSDLISSISLAFYTSVCGVILSTVFNWLYRYCWEDLLQELLYFCREFHSSVILSEEEQEILQRQAFYEKVLRNISEKDLKQN